MIDQKDIESSRPLFLGLQAGKNYGWGVCSEYLIAELSKLTPVQVLEADNGFSDRSDLPGKVFQALKDVNLLPLFEKARGYKNYGYTFFENELTEYSVENAKKYNLVLAGSSWCRSRLEEKGILNCEVLIQGIDPKKFYPIRQKKSFKSFVIFSGGKFELRKGQDLVLKAFKTLQDKYRDMILVNCWYNLWPQSIQLMASSPHIQLPDRSLKPWSTFMNAVFEINGLKTDRIVTFGLVPNYLLRSIYQGTDIGIFPNRCEGGTNLALMEYMACGKPVIASNTSGHRDIINDENAMCLNDLRDISLMNPDKNLIGRWQEPSLDELIEKIEFAYHHRDDLHRIGASGAEHLKDFTWRRSAASLLASIGCCQDAPVDRTEIPTRSNNCAEAYFKLGVIDGELGRAKSAEAHYRQALRLDPHLAEALNNLGLIIKSRQDYPGAKRCFSRAIEIDPGFPQAYLNLGNLYLKEKEFEEARKCFENALQLQPSSAELFFKIGDIYRQANQNNEAINNFKRALKLNPDLPEALFNLAYLHESSGDLDSAIHYYQRVLRIAPASAATLYNLACLVASKGMLDDAIRYAQAVITIKPDHAEAHNNLGNYLKAQGRISDAIRQYREAIHIKPQLAYPHLNLSIALLTAGRFSEGWCEYDWRFEVDAYKADYRYRDREIWNGQSLVGKRLLIHEDQGLGDTIQFVRYLPLVKVFGGEIIFECRSELMALLNGFSGVAQLIARPPDGRLDIDFDYYIPLLSLPGRLNTQLDTIPTDIPYLSAGAEKSAIWHEKMKQQTNRIGFAWAGNNTHVNDHNRSCRLDHFRWLRDVPDLTLFSLQKRVSPAEEIQLNQMGAESLGPRFEGFDDTAAVIDNLDLVITVDTAVAHLAGAMGKETWILLPFDPDWRWLLERTDSPWYPTMRLFRQPRAGDWGGVMASIRSSMERFIGSI